MGEPSADVVDRYGEWGANGIVLWEPEEAKYWPYPAYVWVTPDGRQINDPVRKEDPASWQALELPHNVFAVQVGDEPIPEGAEIGLDRPLPERLSLPDGVEQWTNFSYWTPLTIGESDMEPTLDVLYEGYNGEYNLRNERNVRYVVLDYFRRKGLERRQDYWQYLNGYSGLETRHEKVHSPSDLAWSAFSGAVMGYTGHVWFTYQLGAVGHDEANAGGGSIFFEQPGGWTETPMWQVGAEINAELLTFTEKVADMTSIDVCWSNSGCAGFASDGPILVGSFVHDETGAEWFGVLNSNHTYAGSEEQATVIMPFDGHVCITNGLCSTLAAGQPVVLDAGWPVLVTET